MKCSTLFCVTARLLLCYKIVFLITCVYCDILATKKRPFVDQAHICNLELLIPTPSSGVSTDHCKWSCLFFMSVIHDCDHS